MRPRRTRGRVPKGTLAERLLRLVWIRVLPVVRLTRPERDLGRKAIETRHDIVLAEETGEDRLVRKGTLAERLVRPPSRWA